MTRQISAFPVIFSLLLAAVAAWAQPRTPEALTEAAPDLNTIVSRMEQVQRSNRDRLVAYTVTRQYQLFSGEAPQANSEIIADVSFLPPDQKSYEIQRSVGSDRGEKVVRNILEREAQYARDDGTMISRRNYDFRYLGQQPANGGQCYVLQIDPKQEDKRALKGKLFVDAGSFQIRRFEGTLAKKPSWWIKDMSMVLNFGPVGDMWLQTSSSGTAEVRIFGRHTLTERDLRYTSVMAARTPPSHHRANPHASEAAMGVISPR